MDLLTRMDATFTRVIGARPGTGALCRNCDAPMQDRSSCPDCAYPAAASPPDRGQALCSMCRRRHGHEVQHAAE